MLGHGASWGQPCVMVLLEGPDVQVGPDVVRCQGAAASLLAEG